MKHSLQEEKGMVLVGVIALMLFLGVFCTVAVSMIGSSTGSHLHNLQNAQALALAHAGSEWYLEQLRTDTDWTNQTTQTRNLGQGSFTITILSQTAQRVRFQSTGAVVDGLTTLQIQRVVTQSAQKLLPAFQFALYQGIDPNQNLDLINAGANPTLISGNIWSRGSVSVANSTVVSNGKIFVPNNETVTGGGTYVSRLIAAPYLTMPVLDSSSYLATMQAHDVILNQNSTNAAGPPAGANFVVNGTMRYRDFTTTGNLNITGNGYVVVTRNLVLHDVNVGNLTITPNVGGRIRFIAIQNVTIGRDSANLNININSGCEFYSRASNNAHLLSVSGRNTNITNGLLLSRRRVQVQLGAAVTGDSTLVVNYAGNDNNNWIDINGSNQITTVDGSLISFAQNDQAIWIRNGGNAKTNTVVNGFVYANGDVNTGCRLNEAMIRGSVVCNRFRNDEIQNVSITYSPADFPAIYPAGFGNVVVKEADTWDGW